MPPWEIHLDPPLPYPQARFALEVDPRRRVVRLGHRVPGTGDLEVQAGVISRSFFEREPTDPLPALRWLQSSEAQEMLTKIESGFLCETLWSGDLVAQWTEDAWEVGHVLYLRVALLLAV